MYDKLQTFTLKLTRLLTMLLFGISILACDNSETAGGEKDPADVHPPSEAIPDSATIISDSVIVADTVPDTNKKAGSQDSVAKQ